MAFEYICMRCGNSDYETADFRSAGSLWDALFPTKKKLYLAVTCTRCGYTDIYKRKPENNGS